MMSFFHMGDNIIVLFWSILHQVQQDIKVSRRLVYAKVTFRTNGQQVIYVKFQVTKKFTAKYVVNIQMFSRAA